ncbi:hypothetical protein RclHR1_02240020 [Rhizophagus clarus]|uniref:Protein kinase domain-containing protein n=1 Tax=Rhizophagus clarus TaxID=94130 RepID=A0A2Z6RNZ3_9GLOM|nr:hypothetical protein RclHR1_02240020 [Rhizophagus clarus]
MSLPAIPTLSTCEKCLNKYTNVAHNWCKPCQINNLKENFTKWTSKNKEIDDFIKQQQLQIKTNNDAIFEWIPYNKFNIIKTMNYPIAIWNDGPLKFNKDTKKYERISKEKVSLIYKSNSENIINEFSNEIKKYQTLIYNDLKIYGISQNLDTKDYILVIKSEYCEKCGKKYTDARYNWCYPCQRDFLKNFTNWNSGNKIIDDFIQSMRPYISTNDYNAPIFEWIPYDQFNNIQQIGEKGIANLAIWKNGPLHYDYLGRKEWIRELDKKVCLINYYEIIVATNEFLYEIIQYLYNEQIYGVTQNPHTKNYILVFQNKYCENYCKMCGEKKHTILCNPCIMNNLKENFTKWTSENEIIDDFIKKRQLQIKNYHDTVFEWIPYDQFYNIQIMRKDNFVTAIWKNGPLKFNMNSKRKSDKKVILKYSYNLQSITDEELYSTENCHGISQDPDTKYYILVLQSKYYCKKCGKKYTNTNKWCNPCQLNILMKNFTNWNSGNDNINDFIKEMQLKIGDCNDVVLEWISYDQFNNVEQVGIGGFSTVYSAIWKNKEYKQVALKCVHGSQNVKADFLNEVKIHLRLLQLLQQSLRFGNVRFLNVHGITQEPNTKDFVIVLEYAKGGSFNNWIAKYKGFSWRNKLIILPSIINGLDGIHKNHMVHHDFHTGNILLDEREFSVESQKIFISDMGLCGEIGNTDETKLYGVVPYMAPEILRRKPYTQAADIYSLGMIMYFLATGRQPFAGRDHDHYLMLDICEGIRPKINAPEAPQCYIDLMKRCWDPNPDNRPNTTELKGMINLFWDSINLCGEGRYDIRDQFTEAEAYRKSLLHIKSNESNKSFNSQITQANNYTSRLIIYNTNNHSSDDFSDCAIAD